MIPRHKFANKHITYSTVHNITHDAGSVWEVSDEKINVVSVAAQIDHLRCLQWDEDARSTFGSDVGSYSAVIVYLESTMKYSRTGSCCGVLRRQVYMFLVTIACLGC